MLKQVSVVELVVIQLVLWVAKFLDKVVELVMMIINVGMLIVKYFFYIQELNKLGFQIFRCSELPFDFDALRESLPSRCDLGESVCQGTCNAIGRKTGKCVGGAEVCFIVFNNFTLFEYQSISHISGL